jgi:hypothetical protein
MRADVDGHAAGDPTAVFMHVHNTALPHKLSGAIEYNPRQRLAGLATSMLASGHGTSLTQLIVQVYD